MKSNRNSLKLYDELLQVAQKLFDEVRTGQGLFHSGSCQLNGKTILLMNSNQPIDERIAALSHEISKAGVDSIYIKPMIRSEIELYKTGIDNINRATLPEQSKG